MVPRTRVLKYKLLTENWHEVMCAVAKTDVGVCMALDHTGRVAVIFMNGESRGPFLGKPATTLVHRDVFHILVVLDFSHLVRCEETQFFYHFMTY